MWQICIFQDSSLGEFNYGYVVKNCVSCQQAKSIEIFLAQEWWAPLGEETGRLEQKENLGKQQLSNDFIQGLNLRTKMAYEDSRFKSYSTSLKPAYIPLVDLCTTPKRFKELCLQGK